MTGVGSVNSTGSINVSDIGSGSVQLMFAKLQLTLAQSSKNNAMNYINDIQATQEEQKKVAAYLQFTRQSATNSEGASMGGRGCDDLKSYLDANHLAYSDAGNDTYLSKAEWEVITASLQAKLDSLGSDTQQKMVFVQDFMGQYNSYLQGANSVIQQSNQTLSELAKAR
jgi:hypothetical protein